MLYSFIALPIYFDNKPKEPLYASRSCSRCVQMTVPSIFCFVLLLWFIAGFLVRFSTNGRFACGDIIPKSTTTESFLQILAFLAVPGTV